MKKYAVIKLITLIISVIVLGALIVVRGSSEKIELGIRVGNETINIYENEDGQYLFLPSYADVNATEKKRLVKALNPVVMKSENIPSIFINTRSSDINNIYSDKNYKEPGKMRVYSKDGDLIIRGGLKYIKGRGNYSWNSWDKKSFTLYFEKEVSIYGLAAGHSYALIANASDPTCLRNEIGRQLEQRLNIAGSNSGLFSDLYIDGDYMGNYYLAPAVEVGRGRIDIADLETTMKEIYKKTNVDSLNIYETPKKKALNLLQNPSDITGGYIIEREFVERYETEYGENVSCFSTDGGEYFVVKSPKYCSVDEIEYISNYFDEIEKAILSVDGINPDTGKDISEYIDMESFVKWYIIEEVLKNYDAGVSSTYYFKDSDLVDGRLRISTGWDFDMSLGNYLDWMEYSKEDYSNLTKLGEVASSTNWFAKLYDRDDFQQILREEFRKAVIPYGNELNDNSITVYYNMLHPSVSMDAIRWKDMYASNNFMIGDKAEYDYLADFLNKRLNYLSKIWTTE
ncbi:MAG: CotH kinase family protein [Lachnospiraceae bacterium]|nr:CotH kinase family protein [Candidatus Colinaster scatohippi]